MVPSNILRNQPSHTVALLYGDATIKGTIVQLTCNVMRRIAAHPFTLGANIIHQIMNMQHVAASKNAGNRGL